MVLQIPETLVIFMISLLTYFFHMHLDLAAVKLWSDF